MASFRIIGGRPITITSIPYQLSLRLNGNHICGATLLDHSLAISAAHCFPKSGAYSIKAGITSLREPGEIVHVERALVHPNYTGDSVDYDIALLFLSTPLDFTEKIRPAALPRPSEPVYPGMVGIVSGWGVMYANQKDSYSEELREVEMPVWEWERCKVVYERDVTRRVFCAGWPEGGKDSCQGDSGGPFVVKGILYGIVSAGMDCAQPGFPGIYTNVYVLRGFIREYGNV